MTKAAQWFYSSNFSATPSERSASGSETVYCLVCGGDMGRRDEVVPGVVRCDSCRLRAALASE